MKHFAYLGNNDNDNEKDLPKIIIIGDSGQLAKSCLESITRLKHQGIVQGFKVETVILEQGETFEKSEGDLVFTFEDLIDKDIIKRNSIYGDIERPIYKLENLMLTLPIIDIELQEERTKMNFKNRISKRKI